MCSYMDTWTFTSGGFPHSESHGSRLICSSPWIIAACRVLLRLLVPRHSPYALRSLIVLLAYCFTCFFQIFVFHFFFILFSRFNTMFNLMSNMVEVRRVELLTPCLQGRCSTNWAIPPYKHKKIPFRCFCALLFYQKTYSLSSKFTLFVKIT